MRDGEEGLSFRYVLGLVAIAAVFLVLRGCGV
jgi:hypothetical protein